MCRAAGDLGLVTLRAARVVLRWHHECGGFAADLDSAPDNDPIRSGRLEYRAFLDASRSHERLSRRKWERLTKVTARDREVDADGNDPVLSSIPSSNYDEVWLLGVWLLGADWGPDYGLTRLIARRSRSSGAVGGNHVDARSSRFRRVDLLPWRGRQSALFPYDESRA